ncbi:MAG: TonB family protein [Alphaproteobacteria bacterium]|nr:TonB family protein [Alphaproteobacteria bacterium]
MLASALILLYGSAGLAQPAPSATVPVYPQEAKDAGIEGSVVVLLHRDEQGNVLSVDVVQPVHPLLDAAAVDAARRLVLPLELGRDVQYRFDFYLGSTEVGGPGPASLHGTVVDPDGLAIPRATVTLRRTDEAGHDPIVRTTSSSGRFDVEFLPPGDWDLEVVLSGTAAQHYAIEAQAGDALTSDFVLVPDDALEVVVYAARATWREVDRGEMTANEAPETGVYTLTRRDIEATPGSLEDVTRAAHALPGVVSDGDLLAGFRVRGGETTDVVFQLDRVPLENPFHLAGFNSIFNPDMIDEVTFYAGAAPAEMPTSTSAVMSVVSWDGSPREPGGGLDGALDLSASSARALLMGPIDRDEHFTIALAARRTYLEGYLQVLEWVNLVDSAFAAPEFTELSARAAWRPNDRHRVMLSAVYAGDSLAVVDSEDESVISVDGSFVLANHVTLVSLDHRLLLPSGASWQTTGAWVGDTGFQERTIGGDFRRDDTFGRAFLRTDLDVPLDERLRFQAGADASSLHSASTGNLTDSRSFPTWGQAGIAPFDFPEADVDAEAGWAESNTYVQGRWDGPVRLRAGVRETWAGLRGQWLTSPSAGLSVPLPTGTIPKVTFGLYHRVERDATRLDADFGNPELDAETAAQLVVGVDQAFPLPGMASGGLARIEVYDIELSDLVVTPDDPARIAAGTDFTNAGTGRNQGLDAMVVARQGRWNLQATYSLLFTTRTNPLNTIWPQTIAPAQDQRHTASVAGDLALSAHWRATARYTFHSGRPVSTVVPVDDEHVALTCLNCDRLGPLHQLDLRAEWRRAYRRYRLSFYAEILNVGNIQSDFLPIQDVIDGELSTTMFRHLPMRPFLGLRLDF